MASPQPRIAVVVFPGSNDDKDAAWALAALDAEPVLVWHADEELPEQMTRIPFEEHTTEIEDRDATAPVRRRRQDTRPSARLPAARAG